MPSSNTNPAAEIPSIKQTEQFPVARDTFASFIFGEITERPNSLFRPFANTKIIRFDDFDQLNTKLHQELRITTIISSSFEAEITFVNKQKANVHSFEDFQTFDSSKPVAVNEIVLKFGFLVRHANSQKPELYKIEFGARNRVPHYEKFLIWNADGHESSPPTMRAKVEHVDYMLGKNLMQTIADWIEHLEDSPRDFYFEKIVQNSHLVRILVSNLIALSSLYLGWVVCSHFYSPITQEVLLLSLLTCAALYISFRNIGNWFGSAIEKNLDQTGVGSYVAITKGDEKAICDINQQNKNRFIRSVKWMFGASVIIVLNMISTILMDLITK